ATRVPDRYGERRDILGDDGAGANRRALPDRDAREDDHVPADPAVVADRDRVAELDELAAREHADVMAGRVDVDVRAELDAVADDDQAGVEGGEALSQETVSENR
ncbi:hypothetical protein BO99DRAFT_448946, partial [Aspergillus violaceofuscus CBS 115571]